MIYWLTGESGAGKTTLAKRMLNENTILLDGDDMRETISKDLGFSQKERTENNLRIARLGNLLNKQGYDVIISTICPTDELKQQVYWITKCRFINLEGKFNAI